MAISIQPGTKGGAATEIGIAALTGLVAQVIDNKKPTLVVPIIGVTTVVGVIGALVMKGPMATISTGLASGGAAILATHIPGLIKSSSSSSATGARRPMPVRLSPGLDQSAMQQV
jgi:hypothetical protein